MEIRLLNDMDESGPRGSERLGYYPAAEVVTAEAAAPIDVGLLARKYWLWFVLLMPLGAGAGAAAVIFNLPVYRARAVLEVLNVNEMWLRNAVDITSFESNEVNIQTQLSILQGGEFRNRGAERVRSDVVPVPPPVRGVFARLRERFYRSTRDPLENTKLGLDVAVQTFEARPIHNTRLIELACDSTNPQVAAMFLNAMAEEFVEESSRAHMLSSQKTGELLSRQIDETKSKLQDAEDQLRAFVQVSGNLFAGQETLTLADMQLAQAKAKLTEVQSQRIAAQTRYEMSLKTDPASLPEARTDGTLRMYEDRINTLKQTRAALLLTFTEKHEKVKAVDVQLAELTQVYQQQLNAIVGKIKDDYETALREEKHRSDDYAEKARRAGAETGKAAQYAELKREVENLRQMYQSLLVQSNQAGVSSAGSVNPIRIVERSTPPGAPYKPRPLLNLSFGTLIGTLLAAGIVFLRERMDPSVRVPGSMRRWLNTPELGVIPNLYANRNGSPELQAGSLSGLGAIEAGAGTEAATRALTLWRDTPAFVTESFRGTLASILRHRSGGVKPRVLLVTSPGPGEGKTTVVQNLGIALAETGRKVLLVDADFRRPHLHKKFHMRNEPSLVDLLLAKEPSADADTKYLGVSSGIPGLFVVPNRPTDEHVAKLLYSPKLRSFFQNLRSQYDMILVDAPPFLHLADARIMAPLTDAVILVLRSGATSKAHAMEAFRRIQEDGLPFLGTILTAWQASSSYLRRHYYYYDYADDNAKR